MTLTNEKRLIRHEGNGATTNFPYDFLIPDANSVIVSLWNEATDTTTVLNPSQYNITGLGDPNFGEVTYPLSGPPIAAGTWLVIEREVAYTQDLLIKNQGGFFADSTMAQLDRIVMQTQQLAEMLERAPKFSPGSGVSNRRITQGDEGTALIWDADGNIVEGPSTTEIESAQTYATVAKAAAALAQAGAGAPVFSTKAIAEAYSPDTAPDFIETAGYSTAGDGGGGLYVQVPSEPTDLPNPAKVQLLDGTWLRLHGKVYDLAQLGVKADGSTVNGTVFEDLIGYMADWDGILTHEQPGIIKLNRTFQIPRNASFRGPGSSKLLFDSRGVSNEVWTDNAVVYKLGGEPEVLGVALGGDVSWMAGSLTFASSHGLSAGDLILLYDPTDSSYSPWRESYRAGEYCEVLAVPQSDEVTLTNGILYDQGYDDADITVYVCPDFGTGEVTGLTVYAPDEQSSVRALVLQYLRNLRLFDISAEKSGHASLVINKCVGVRGLFVRAVQTIPDFGLGTQYGCSVSNSQDVDIGSVYFEGARHGVAVGGDDDFSIPNRLIHVHDGIAKNQSGSLAAADWHGNVEMSSYQRLRLLVGGFNCAGHRNVVADIEAEGADLLLCLGREMVSTDHEFRNIRARSGRNDTTRGIFDIGGNSVAFGSDSRSGGTLRLHNIEIDAPNQTRSGIGIRNRGFVGDWGIEASDISYNAPNADGSASAAIAIATFSGDNPDFVKIGGKIKSSVQPVRLSGAGDNTAAVSGLRESGTASGTTSTSSGVLQVSVNFARPFPKAPHVVCQTNNFTTNGSDRIAADPSSVTVNGFNFNFRRVDATSNFAAALAISGSWVATLDEV